MRDLLRNGFNYDLADLGWFHLQNYTAGVVRGVEWHWLVPFVQRRESILLVRFGHSIGDLSMFLS